MENAQQILSTWQVNAEAWSDAIDQQAIESRNLVTNQAIIDAITKRQPKSLLDVGCGEGWLCRDLAAKGIACTGVDAIPALIDLAKAKGGAEYFVYGYADLMLQKFVPQNLFDVVAINFALFEDDPTLRKLFVSLKALLNKEGSLVIQTLHPVTACGNASYEDGWREGTWAGFSNQFTQPAPWYFRTIESWKSLLTSANYTIVEMAEPTNPVSKLPASLIFTCKK
jgi:2-polyprenyl-3-methyl-5-hydroxy-6-metoxy-1,4-benzoquinol methylase